MAIYHILGLDKFGFELISGDAYTNPSRPMYTSNLQRRGPLFEILSTIGFIIGIVLTAVGAHYAKLKLMPITTMIQARVRLS